ncbi:MAG: nucleotidyl transferase AbiEii/AbiGii toxin family protein, partial [Methanobacterium sp.]|nr:nucleotidyl transferase AbiEii/AbiGii toxin family protein [Methanobacterium sp.]
MPSFPVPDGPHNDPWKSLLRPVYAVIDEVVKEHGVEFPIQIGGGSMLLRRYRHRKSKDLDLFVLDVRLARWCSPRFSDTAADLFPDYGEDAVATKLILGMQEIDIITAAPIVLEDDCEKAMLEGREVLVERPREILAKKVVYRGRLFQPRDVFDLACGAEVDPDEVAAVLPWLTVTHVADLEARLNEIEPVLAAELAGKGAP